MISATGIVLAHPAKSPLLRLASRPSQELSRPFSEARFLSLVLVIFLGLVLVLDPIHPISVFRYYIVTLPLLSYLGGDLWLLSWRLPQTAKVLIATLLVIYIALQVATSSEFLKAKHYPLVDYKKMALFVKNANLCAGGCRSLGWPHDALKGSYFANVNLLDFPDALVASASQLKQPILLFHEQVKSLPILRSRHPELRCWEAPGSLWDSFVLIPSNQPERDAIRFGLKRCQP